MSNGNYRIIEGSPKRVADICDELMDRHWKCNGPLYLIQLGDNIIAFQGMTLTPSNSSNG